MASFPGYKCASPLGDSADSSMIFERNVEDTCSGLPFSRRGSTAGVLSRQHSGNGLGQPIMISATRCGSRASRMSHRSSSCSQVSPLDSPELLSRNGSVDQRRNLENFVAPALDASCSIIADESTSFNNLDIVYMRKPSTIGLDMALGKTRSDSFAMLKSETQQTPKSSDLEENPRTLRFYSYADMLSDEMATSPGSAARRPRLSLSYTAPPPSARLSPQNPTMHFSNPFKTTTSTNDADTKLRRYSAASADNLSVKPTTRSSNNLLSRSPTSQAPLQIPPKSSGPPLLSVGRRSHKLSKPKPKTAFQVESSGSDEFSSNEEDEGSFSQDNSNNNGNLVFFPLSSGVPRATAQSGVNSQGSSQRGNHGAIPIPNRGREPVQGSIGGLLMEDTLQTKKVSDLLKKEMGIKRKQDLT